MMALNGIFGKAEQMMDHIDEWGGPTTFPHYAIGWAWATNTPFQWTKQVSSHFGGWTLYFKDGTPRHEYNFFALERTNIGGDAPLPAGKHTVSYEFIPDAAKPGTGGKSILRVNGKKNRRSPHPQNPAFLLLRRRRRGRRHRRGNQRLARLPIRHPQHLHR
jgi:hypothetical protein